MPDNTFRSVKGGKFKLQTNVKDKMLCISIVKVTTRSFFKLKSNKKPRQQLVRHVIIFGHLDLIHRFVHCVPLMNLVFNAGPMKYSILENVCAVHISLKSQSVQNSSGDCIHIRKQDILIPNFCLNWFVAKGSINISCFITALGNLWYNLFQQMKHTCTLDFREIFPHMWSTCISSSCRSEMVLPVCFWTGCWYALVHFTAGCIQRYIKDQKYSWGTQLRFVSQEHTCILNRCWLRKRGQLKPRTIHDVRG